MIKIQWKALKKTKEEIIKYLRAYLANPDNYTSILPPELTVEHIQMVKVYDTQPEDLRSFPMVVLTGASGDIITSGLGDMALEIYNPITGELLGYKYGGMYEFSITLEIGTRTTLSREFLTDLITMALRLYLRKQLEAEGILIKNMRYGGESNLMYNADPIFVSTINLSTWSEWYEDYELLPVDKVNFNPIQ